MFSRFFPPTHVLKRGKRFCILYAACPFFMFCDKFVNCCFPLLQTEKGICYIKNVKLITNKHLPLCLTVKNFSHPLCCHKTKKKPQTFVCGFFFNCLIKIKRLHFWLKTLPISIEADGERFVELSPASHCPI